MCENKDTALTVQSEQLNEVMAKPTGGFIESFRESYKLASVLAKSSLVPQQYQGKTEDCALAIDMAERMGVSPLMVMQSLYVVKGKPSWSGQACMSFIKAKYGDAQPVYTGQRGTDTRGCFVRVIKPDGEVIEGTEVTIAMAKSEGWMSNSKWKNMPEQMLAYRAAAFFARVYCPEILMGVSVEGEVEDMQPSQPQKAPDPFKTEVIE
ncbi:hypothetical protein [Ruminococcus flavefaciens]|uniref:hypothetical protein n=1 Tax=Ruminococcus flavefaciens TaxID=1265 RepID=UPI0015635A7D|nr:hypothetical protein [Ruminococcus flavefaciens]